MRAHVAEHTVDHEAPHAVERFPEASPVSWVNMMLMGDFGRSMKIDEVENDVERLRSRVHSQARTDQSQDEALLTLRREVTELKVVVAELTRLLVAGGAVPAESVERMVRALETPRTIGR